MKAARGKDCKLLTATAGQLIGAIAQAIPYQDMDDKQALGTFKLDSSPKWFTHVSTEMTASGNMVVTLGVIAGVKTPTGRVARIAGRSGIGIPGASQITEYYYQIS